MSTFIIGGIAANRALTTRRMPSFLEIIRNGRRALNALSAFRDLSWEVLTLPVSWNKVNTGYFVKMSLRFTKNDTLFHKKVTYFLYKMTLFNNFNKFQNSIFNKTIINDFSNQSYLLLTKFILFNWHILNYIFYYFLI